MLLIFIMSDNNLADKLSDAITNAFKKTEVFEKIGTYKFYLNSFLILTFVFGVTSISINIQNMNKINDVKQDMQGSENVLKYNIECNRKRDLIEHCSLKSEILVLNKQMSLLLENQEKIINQLEEIALIKISEQNRLAINISKIDCMSASTSMNTFTPIKMTEIIDDKNKRNVSDDIKDQEYDELTNECYDAIPLNNLKKTTGLSWLFK